MVAEALLDHPAWVRVNAARTAWCAADLDAVADAPSASASPRSSPPTTWRGSPSGPPASRSSAPSRARAVCWPRRRSPRCPGSGTWPWAASTCSATSTRPAATCRRSTPVHIWSWPPAPRGSSRPSTASSRCLDDDAGLRDQADFARSLGFFGKSAIHPRQLRRSCTRFSPRPPGDRLGAGGSGCVRGRRRGGVRLPDRRVRRPARSPTGRAGCWRSRREAPRSRAMSVL